jgi:hypothetical protein
MADLMDSMQNSWVDSVINQYRNLNFVDRVAHPDKYPTLPLDDENIATHLMMWGNLDDGTAIVYPSVVYDDATKALKKLDDDAAFDYALKSGEYIPFPNDNAADTFSREYKRHWRDGKEPRHRGAPPQK